MTAILRYRCRSCEKTFDLTAEKPTRMPLVKWINSASVLEHDHGDGWFGVSELIAVSVKE